MKITLKADFQMNSVKNRQSSGQDSVLSLPRAQVQSLAGKLRSHKLGGMVKKNKTPNQNKAKRPAFEPWPSN